MELERVPALAGTACACPGGSSSQAWRAANPQFGYSPFLFPVEVAPKEGGERSGGEKAPPGSRRLGQHLLGRHIAFLPCLMAAGCARAGKTIPQKSKLQGKMRSPVLSFEALRASSEISPTHGFPLENGAFLGGVPGPHWVLVPKGSSRPGNTESLCAQGSRHLALPSRLDRVWSSVAWIPSEESHPPWPYVHPPHRVGSHRLRVSTLTACALRVLGKAPGPFWTCLGRVHFRISSRRRKNTCDFHTGRSASSETM